MELYDQQSTPEEVGQWLRLKFLGLKWYCMEYLVASQQDHINTLVL